MIWSKGTGVSHPIYGRGIVLASRHRGYEYLVKFNTKLKGWIPKRELKEDKYGLRLVFPKEEPKLAGPVLLKDEISPKRRLEEIALIEAFRFGIVPNTSIEEWTVGRQQEIKKVNEWLHDQSEGAFIIEGPYGSGKTHLLRYLRQTALEAGYAVANAHFDPAETTAAFPKKLYRRIIQDFQVKIKGQYLDFKEMLEFIAKHSKENPISDHFFLGPLLDLLLEQQDINKIWPWIQAQTTMAPPPKFRYALYDYTTVSNIYCNILSGIGWLVAKVLKLNGFLILLDEAETAKTGFYTYHISRGLNLFKGLALTANDDPILLEEKVIKKRGLRQGEKTQLIYSGHLPIPFLYRIPSFLKVIFAITPGVITSDFIKWRQSIPTLYLDFITPEELWKSFVKFIQLYKDIYRVNIPRNLQRQCFNLLLEVSGYSSIRIFIKGMTELMDFLRFYPNEDIEKLL